MNRLGVRRADSVTAADRRAVGGDSGDLVRVLVVEDEVALAEVIRAGLVDEGFAVDVQHTGVDGLWAATENPYDVVVLDIMLPGLNGYEVCRQLRSREVWTPVLMLTAKDGEYDQADAFDLGADDYLIKPFSFVVLVARLRALVRRGAPARPVVLTAGDLAVDPARRQVIRGGQPVAGDRTGVRAAGVPDAPPRRRGLQSRRSSRTSGTPTSTAIPTSSRCTSATCAARSTSRSAGTPSRPSGAWATGWRPTAGDTGRVLSGSPQPRPT